MNRSLPIPSCCLTYPLQRTGRAVPARCPGRVLLSQVSFGQTASLHPLRRRLPGLFGDFIGTTGLSDFPWSFIVGVRPWTSRRVPRAPSPRANTGSPGSRARCFRTCSGSLTARDPVASRDIDAPGVAFRFLLQRRRPGVWFFRGSIPGPHVPLSTLRRGPRGPLRMTRGRCGSLVLHRMTLSFTTPRRFSRRTGN